MKVTTMIDNQFVIENGNARTFQSYETRIAEYSPGLLMFGRMWDCSRTTSRWFYEFCRRCTPIANPSHELFKKAEDEVVTVDGVTLVYRRDME